MRPEENKFQLFLSEIVQKEKRAYRWAIVLTAIPIAVSIGLFSFLTYRVIKLRRESVILDQQIQAKTNQLDRLQRDLGDAKDSLAEITHRLELSKQALRDIEAGTVNAKKKASQTLNLIAKPPARAKSTAETTAPGSAEKVDSETANIGFSGNNYRGPDKTVVKVEVIPVGTRQAVSYDIDGTIGKLRGTSKTFYFTLDKSKHNPTRLFIFFDFYGEADAVYKVTIKASDGHVLHIEVPSEGHPMLRSYFEFEIL